MSDRTVFLFKPIEVGGIRYEAQKRAPEGQLTPLRAGTKHAGLIVDQYGSPAFAPRPVLRIYDPETGDFCWYVPAIQAPDPEAA